MGFICRNLTLCNNELLYKRSVIKTRPLFFAFCNKNRPYNEIIFLKGVFIMEKMQVILLVVGVVNFVFWGLVKKALGYSFW